LRLRDARREAVVDLAGALSALRVQGPDRVRLHADLTILAKLACALARERLAYLAAQSLAGNVPLGGIALRADPPLGLNALSEVLEFHAGSYGDAVRSQMALSRNVRRFPVVSTLYCVRHFASRFAGPS
jgi:hypothetical protein